MGRAARSCGPAVDVEVIRYGRDGFAAVTGVFVRASEALGADARALAALGRSRAMARTANNLAAPPPLGRIEFEGNAGRGDAHP